jgi:hypothetical protein
MLNIPSVENHVRQLAFSLRGKLISAGDPLEAMIQDIYSTTKTNQNASSEITAWSDLDLNPASSDLSLGTDIPTGMSCLDMEEPVDLPQGTQEPTLEEILESDAVSSCPPDSSDELEQDQGVNFVHNLPNILRYSPLSYIHSQTALPELDSLVINHARSPDDKECQTSFNLYLDREVLCPEITNIPERTIKVFCDGGFLAQSQTGSYGTLGVSTNGILWKASRGFHPVFSSFGSELKGLRNSLNHLFRAPSSTAEAWIFTDSQMID